MDFSKKKFNIIGEVMSDGQGDWSWVFYIVKQLISFGAKPNNINIIYYNVYDNNTTIKNLKKLSSVLKNLKCSNTIKDEIFNNKELLFFLLNQKFLQDVKDKILTEFTEKIYKLEKHFTAEETAKIFDILKELNNGYREMLQINGNPIKQISNKKICYFNNNSIRFNIDNINYTIGNSLYSINNIKDLNIDKIKTIKIYLFSADNNPDKLEEKLENKINIIFRTQQENTDFMTKIVASRYKIIMREGGHSDDNALNCNPNFGYVQANPLGDEKQLNNYIKTNNLPNIDKINVAYISLGKKAEEADKLLLFIKILSQVTEDLSGNTIGIIGDVFKNIFITNVSGKKSLFVISKEEDNKITIKYNSKTFYIVPLQRINFVYDGFNFAYFLKKANKYCMLSGDMSYMEGLTIGDKIVIHVGMSNKYNMINELKNKIISEFRSMSKFVDTDLDNSYERIIEKDTSINKYSIFLSDPEYINKQNNICSNDFNIALKTKIEEEIRFIEFGPIIPRFLKFLDSNRDEFINSIPPCNYGSTYITFDNLLTNLKDPINGINEKNLIENLDKFNNNLSQLLSDYINEGLNITPDRKQKIINLCIHILNAMNTYSFIDDTAYENSSTNPTFVNFKNKYLKYKHKYLKLKQKF
jgi:hypothetical protein